MLSRLPSSMFRRQDSDAYVSEKLSKRSSQLTPAQEYRLQALAGSPPLAPTPTKESSNFTLPMSLHDFSSFAARLSPDCLLTRLASSDGRHMVLYGWFTHEGVEYYLRIRRPYGRLERAWRRTWGLSCPDPVELSSIEFPRARRATQVVLYTWRLHYPTLDLSDPLALPALAQTEPNAHLCRLLNSIGNPSTYSLKPHLTLTRLSSLLELSASLTPSLLPGAFRDRFFSWQVLFLALEHFGHDLFVRYRSSVHPEYVLSLRHRLGHFGPVASLPFALLVMGLTALAYIPVWLLLGFLFRSRGWDVGGVFYLLIALPAGLLSPLPALLFQHTSRRITRASSHYRNTLTSAIRSAYAGYSHDSSLQSTSYPLGPNVSQHSPLFPHLASLDIGILPPIASLPPQPIPAFLHTLLSRPALAYAPVQAVQARQLRSSPFSAAYLVLFVNLAGQDIAIRLDPPSRALLPWRPYAQRTSPSLVRLVSVAAEEAPLVIEDEAESGSAILYTLNSWKTAFLDFRPEEPKELVALSTQSRAAHRRLTSLSDTPALLPAAPTPTLQDVCRAVLEAYGELHPGLSEGMFSLRTVLAVVWGLALAYPGEYLPSEGDAKSPVHPRSFRESGPYLLQAHRTMLLHLNATFTALFYCLLIGLAFVHPEAYEAYVVANCTILVSVQVVWWAVVRTGWTGWLGEVEGGIGRAGRGVGRVLPVPKVALATESEKSAKGEWDVPPMPPGGLIARDSAGVTPSPAPPRPLPQTPTAPTPPQQDTGYFNTSHYAPLGIPVPPIPVALGPEVPPVLMPGRQRQIDLDGLVPVLPPGTPRGRSRGVSPVRSQRQGQGHEGEVRLHVHGEGVVPVDVVVSPGQ